MFHDQPSLDELKLQMEDLLTNPIARVPVALCLDVSGSMSGPKMDELNNGIDQFFTALRDDPMARSSAEVAMIAFGDQAVLILNYQSLDRVGQPPRLSCGGAAGLSTNLGGGVRLALSTLQQRKQDYKRGGVDYFQPMLVLMTDGQPTTNEHAQAAQQTCELESQNKLVVLPIGIGADADMGVLATFSRKNSPLRLKGLCFREFFRWLSKSIVRVSQSRPGEKVTLDTGGIKGWAEI